MQCFKILFQDFKNALKDKFIIWFYLVRAGGDALHRLFFY